MMLTAAARPLAATIGRRAAFLRSFATVGSQIPNVELHKNFPPERIKIGDYLKDKNVVIVGLPGAFTPT
jgi:hypothetical protein